MDLHRVVSEDAVVARETMDRLYPGCISGRMPEGRGHFSWESVRTEDVTIVEWATTTPLRLEVELDPLWGVARVEGAGVRGTVGPHPLDVRAAQLLPPRPFRVEWLDVRVRGATFDGRQAERAAQEQVGDDRLVLEPLGTRAISRLHEEYWWSAWRHACDALKTLEGRDEPLVEATIRATVVAAALYAFPTTLSDHRYDGRQDRTPEARVRRAMVFIDDNAHRPIESMDVAREVGMTGRGLRTAFRRAGMGLPADYLRRTRLEAVRRQLRGAGPAESTDDIARQWGFPRPGPFARLYRREFGVTPDDDRPEA